jgi:hypothetical protein
VGKRVCLRVLFSSITVEDRSPPTTILFFGGSSIAMRFRKRLERIGSLSLIFGFGAALAACSPNQTMTVPGPLPAQQNASAPASLSSNMRVTSAKSVAVTYDLGGGHSPVSFQTAPLSLCTLQAKDTHMVTASDQFGRVGFEIAIPHAQASTSAAFLCKKGASSELVRLNFVPGHVAPRRASAIAVPADAQMEAFAHQNGFDPRTAPNSVLIAHNLPPRAPDFASHPNDHNGWLKAVYSPNTRVITEGVELPGVTTHRPMMARTMTPDVNSPPGATDLTLANWSGYSTTGVAGTWNTVVGDWVNPITCNCSYNPSHASLWVGIDGADQSVDGGSDGNVFQTGLSIEFNVSSGVQYYNYSGWWELYPNNAQTQLFTTYANDEMYATVYKYIANDTVYSHFYLKDVTMGTVSSFNITAGAQLKGDTAEWIMEAPDVGGSESKLLDFAQPTMSEAQAISGSTTYNFNKIPSQTSYTLFNINMMMNTKEDANAFWASGLGNGYIKWTWDGCC